ncbi:MAG: transcriptional repressor [Chloroflexi bacterium]|nr:transcriptional repressor [Chloroflexota bacterium]
MVRKESSMVGSARPTKPASARQVLNSSSRRVTAQRTLLLDLIRHSDGHLDAEGLYRLAKEKHARINLSTVYRNLQLFKKLGLIEERHFTEEHHHYEAKATAEHQHLCCLGCGKVVEFDFHLTQNLKGKIGKEYDFDITGVEVSLTGLCSDCRQDEKRK